MKDLVQKYWEGKTTLPEEQELREYLKRAPATTENRQLMKLLTWYDQEALQKIPTPLTVETLKKPSSAKRIRLLRWAAGLAATVLLLFSLYFLRGPGTQQVPSQNLAYLDTFDDPEEAYEATQKALMMLSSKMNAAKKHKKKLKKIEILSDLVESYKKN